ncbi:hypothetical protein [Meiothermus rufus]|uniref:hypothetical protein n=1 Tax=Meiothermus rufus TaxID=604332 RepID=UPI001FDFA006|nr:hypothetical protein [Meiothermus rufus]
MGQSNGGPWGKVWGVILTALVALGVGFGLGRLSLPPGGMLQAGSGPTLHPVQFDPQQPLPPAPDPRELIPLQPGPGQPQPGQGQGEECPILIYQDGQLFRFDRPGQPLPGPGGPLPGPGMPEGSPELIPLDPLNPAPPLPTPAPPQTGPDRNI